MTDTLWRRRVAAAVLAIALLVMWVSQFTGAPLIGDAAQQVRMGYNLAHHGVLSMEKQAPFEPTNYREPLPAWVHAASIRALELVAGVAPPEAYVAGARLRCLKFENVLWLGLLSAAAFIAVRGMSGSYWLALAAVACLNVTFRPTSGISAVDDLMTEIPAAAVLVAGSYALSIGVVLQRRRWLLAAGLLFGVLTLIKAAVLYVFVASAALLLAVGWLVRRMPLRTLLGMAATSMAAFLCVVSPWIYRNYVLLGTMQIAQRGGEALYERALQDRMNAVEYRGAYYFWAPPSLQDWFGRHLGFSPRDLERGGSLQRLNDDPSSPLSTEDLEWELKGRPDQTVTFYRQARAARVQLVQQYQDAGQSVQSSFIHADRVLESRAVAMIEQRPGAHAALVVPLLWRGAVRVLPILAFVLFVGVLRSNYQLLVFVLPALMIVLVHAVCIIFIPRYSAPTYDLGILAALVAARELWIWLLERRRHQGAGDPVSLK